MTQNTSSPKSYNVMALRGAQVDDMEYVEMFNLDPSIAYTPAINDAMLEMTYQQNIDAGVDEKQAMENKLNAQRDVKKLMAKNGMLK